MSLIWVLLSLLATFNENIFFLLNCFPKLSGVSFARSCPFAIITVREHTASTSSNICVDITIALLVEIFFIKSLISYF